MSAEETTNTLKPKDVQLTFKDRPNLPYTKADFGRSCRIGNEIAITFYQHDYMRLALALQRDADKPFAADLHPLARVVMNEESFVQLLDDLVGLASATGIKWEPKINDRK